MALEKIRKARNRACSLMDRALKEEERAKPSYETVVKAVRIINKSHAARLERIKEQESKHAAVLRDLKRRIC